MADSKITALASIGTGTDPANDPLVIVDVSDVSPGGMSATGTTKKVTLNNLLACSPTATLASATITGDLTVDTSTLKVDSANNRVGIVQATPLYPLHLVGEFGLQEDNPAGTGTKLRFIGDATKYNFRLGKQLTANNTFEITPSTAVGGGTFSNPVYTVTNDGIHTFLDGAGGTRMTLNSNGLGVGTSPSYKIHALSTSVDIARFERSGAGGSARIQLVNGSGTAWYFRNGVNDLVFNYEGTDLVTFGSSGNVGIGVTPAGTGGCLQLKSGITFPATQVASSDANTLDDYEEGTWTIGLAFGGGSTGLTTSSNTGRYTKIGRVVTVSGLLVLTNKGSSTGAASVTGLPFSIGNNNESYPAASLRLNGISYTGAFQAFGTIGSTFISFEQISTAGSVSSLTDSNFTNVSSFIFSLTYTV